MPFVTFEGVDGAGKSTQVRLTSAWLAEQGADVVQTKEPDGGHLGPAIRKILTTPRDRPLDPHEELLLVFAARYDHVRSVVRPALARGAWVLSDRYLDSTYALQIHGTGLSLELFKALAGSVVGSTMPDLTLVFDLDPAVALERRAARADATDPAERTRDFDRIAAAFNNLVCSDPRRCRLIDGSGPEEEVFARTRDAILGSGLLHPSAGIA